MLTFAFAFPLGGEKCWMRNSSIFPDGRWKSNFLCNLGKGDPAKIFARSPRLTFEEACRLA